ncbi:MAG: hypothetical protein M3Y24_00400 [Acidobacteriota bacterium]|nr:hypothetical protein [Acidobacteriota bacterium]
MTSIEKWKGLLNVSVGSVHGGQELNTLKSWDSLTILEFIVLADTDYSSDVQPAAITNCKSVDDLAQLTFAHSALNDESIHTRDN